MPRINPFTDGKFKFNPLQTTLNVLCCCAALLLFTFHSGGRLFADYILKMDKYSDLSRIGEGSFGRVYKATEISSKKTVALKVITKVWKNSKIPQIYSSITCCSPTHTARKIIKGTETPPARMRDPTQPLPPEHHPDA